MRAQVSIIESTKHEERVGSNRSLTGCSLLHPKLRLDRISHILVSRSGKSTEIESRFVAFRGWGEGKENGLLMAMMFLSDVIKMFQN